MATVDDRGSFRNTRRAQTSKPTLWCWQQRYLSEGIAGLKRGNTRPLRVPPLPHEISLKMMAKTMQGGLPNASHWRC